MRNEEKGAGHGQGRELNEAPKELAELGVHLSGVLIHYLIKRHLNKTRLEKQIMSSGEEDLSF